MVDAESSKLFEFCRNKEVDSDAKLFWRERFSGANIFGLALLAVKLLLLLPPPNPPNAPISNSGTSDGVGALLNAETLGAPLGEMTFPRGVDGRSSAFEFSSSNIEEIVLRAEDVDSAGTSLLFILSMCAITFRIAALARCALRRTIQSCKTAGW